MGNEQRLQVLFDRLLAMEAHRIRWACVIQLEYIFCVSEVVLGLLHPQ